MKIDRTNNYSNKTSFTSLDAKKAENLLFSRLSNYKRYRAYDILKREIEALPYTIELSASKNGKRLQGRIVMPGYEMKQESLLSACLNLSPVRFIKNLYNEAKALQSCKTHLDLLSNKPIE